MRASGMRSGRDDRIGEHPGKLMQRTEVLGTLYQDCLEPVCGGLEPPDPQGDPAGSSVNLIPGRAPCRHPVRPFDRHVGYAMGAADSRFFVDSIDTTINLF